MAIKIDDLGKISIEFPEVYDELFDKAVKRVKMALDVKRLTVEKIKKFKSQFIMKIKRGDFLAR